MNTYNNMEAKRITINQAKKVLENIRTVHTLPNKFETFCDYLKKFML